MASEKAASPVNGELRARAISAVLLAPVAVAAVIFGGLAFAALVTIVGALAFWEWTGLTGASDPAWSRVLALLCLAAGLLALSFRGAGWSIALIAFPAFLGLVAGYRRRAFRWIGLGLLYVSIPCAGFIILRRVEPFGWGAVLFIVAVVWATDIAGFFGGRALGGPKLWQRISPKKTWSGALCGLLAAVAAGGLVIVVARPGSFAAGLLLAGILSVAAQAGDLLESAIKRNFGVKDSGHIIPGHGGVLDRVDGLFGAAAAAWLIAGVGLGEQILRLPRDIAAMAGGGS